MPGLFLGELDKVQPLSVPSVLTCAMMGSSLAEALYRTRSRISSDFSLRVLIRSNALS